jgi:hypothetical protein
VKFYEASETVSEQVRIWSFGGDKEEEKSDVYEILLEPENKFLKIDSRLVGKWVNGFQLFSLILYNSQCETFRLLFYPPNT